jgi:hypothetical protein
MGACSSKSRGAGRAADSSKRMFAVHVLQPPWLTDANGAKLTPGRCTFLSARFVAGVIFHRGASSYNSKGQNEVASGKSVQETTPKVQLFQFPGHGINWV